MRGQEPPSQGIDKANMQGLCLAREQGGELRAVIGVVTSMAA
ncbi:hypothetical protein SAMN06265784_102194 [Paraburkholderia susongensis]|uniref:Uncharacterized protein n=1 Tax=Paraburkholderia susongensis TaxID=1515439 RepID=A0A1X7J527_9BURK|nr:hypothetical protein SAMN06265784_102194 [Paraburkholderia susongensis]